MRFHFLVVSAVIWILFTGTGYAQTFTGTFDGYWSYNTNTPAFQLNSFRAFDIHDQAFSMNYAELAVAYKPKDVGFRAVTDHSCPNWVSPNLWSPGLARV